MNTARRVVGCLISLIGLCAVASALALPFAPEFKHLQLQPKTLAFLFSWFLLVGLYMGWAGTTIYGYASEGKEHGHA